MNWIKTRFGLTCGSADGVVSYLLRISSMRLFWPYPDEIKNLNTMLNTTAPVFVKINRNTPPNTKSFLCKIKTNQRLASVARPPNFLFVSDFPYPVFGSVC